MNNIVLLINLLLILILILYANKRNYFCASFFLALVFIISTLFICFSPTYKGFELSGITIITLPILIFMFFIGESLAWFFYHKKYYYIKPYNFRHITTSNHLYYFSLAFIGLISFINFYYYYYKIATSYGASDFFSAYVIMRGLITKMADGNLIELMLVKPKLLVYATTFAELLSYLFSYVFMYNRMLFGKSNYKYIIPTIVYIPTLASATGRAAYFPLFIFFISLFLLVFKLRSGWFQRNLKVERKIVLYLSFFLLFFLIMGAGNLKKQSKDGELGENFVLNTLSNYIGSPVAGFDYFLNNQNENKSLYPGHMTFEGIYKFFNLFGADFQNNPRNLDKFYINGESSNVYSGMYYIVSDYGIGGSFIFLFIMGLIHGIIFMKFKYGLFLIDNYFHIYIFTSIFTSIVMMFFNYRYYIYFSLGFAIQLLFLWIIQRKFLIYR